MRRVIYKTEEFENIIPPAAGQKFSRDLFPSGSDITNTTSGRIKRRKNRQAFLPLSVSLKKGTFSFVNLCCYFHDDRGEAKAAIWTHSTKKFMQIVLGSLKRNISTGFSGQYVLFGYLS